MEFAEFSELMREVAERGETPVNTFKPFNEMAFGVLVDTKPGRNHLVHVLGAGEVVRCFATALELPEGQQLTAEMSSYLLRRNATEPHGKWCMKDDASGQLRICVRDGFFLSDMPPGMALYRIVAVAQMADAFEAELGRDVN